MRQKISEWKLIDESKTVAIDAGKKLVENAAKINQNKITSD